MYKYLFLIQNILKNIIFITNVINVTNCYKCYKYVINVINVIKIELQKYNIKIQYKL